MNFGFETQLLKWISLSTKLTIYVLALVTGRTE